MNGGVRSENLLEQIVALQREVERLRGTEELQTRLETALSVSRATLEATADGILVLDLNEHITGYNRRFSELWHVPPGFVEERGYAATLQFVLDQLQHPETCLRRLQEVMTDPESESTDVLEFLDGRVFERYSRPQRLDGKVVGRVFSYRDITARTRAEAALREREARQVALAHASRSFAEAGLDLDTVLTTTARLVGDFFDDCSMVRLFMGEMADLRTVAVYHRDPAVASVLRQFAQAAQTPIDDAATEQIWRTGRPVLVSASPSEARKRVRPEFQAIFDRIPVHSWMIVPLRVGGRITGAVTAARFREGPAYSSGDQAFLQELADRAALTIDNARLYEDARQAVRLREEFISIASHELKTPLTPLKLKLQLLTKALTRAGTAGLEGRQVDLVPLLAESDAQLNAITRLVDDMLDFARIQSGSFALKREEIDLTSVAEAAVERARPYLREAAIRLVAAGAVRGHWDRLRLEQVFANLLSNAVRYGGGSDVEVRVAGDDGRATFSVHDGGMGIPEEDQARIFERFERARPARNYGGLGLGLYIVRQIVNAHGGSIGVQSTPGQGATFTVTLPAG